MAEAAPRESTTAWGSSPSETCDSGGPEELSMAANLRLTAAAAAELGHRQPLREHRGQMHLDLTPGECAQHVLRIRAGHLAGVAIARADGVTLHAPAEQLKLLEGLCLDYRGDLSGGGFLIRNSDGVEPCACGSASAAFEGDRHPVSWSIVESGRESDRSPTIDANHPTADPH